MRENAVAQAQATKRLKDHYIDWVPLYFKNGDFAITLTFRDTYKQDPILRNQDIGHYLRRVNCKFFGQLFRKGRRRLNCVYVFELNGDRTAIHTHMILENPAVSRLDDSARIPLLLNSWMDMEHSGVYAANKIEVTYDSNGWVDYMFKRTAVRSDHMVGVDNWSLN